MTCSVVKRELHRRVQKNKNTKNMNKYRRNVMEVIIAIFLGAFLSAIGVVGYIRICKDFKEDKK